MRLRALGTVSAGRYRLFFKRLQVFYTQDMVTAGRVIITYVCMYVLLRAYAHGSPSTLHGLPRKAGLCPKPTRATTRGALVLSFLPILANGRFSCQRIGSRMATRIFAPGPLFRISQVDASTCGTTEACLCACCGQKGRTLSAASAGISVRTAAAPPRDGRTAPRRLGSHPLLWPHATADASSLQACAAIMRNH